MGLAGHPMCLGDDAATEKDARLRIEQASAPAIASWGLVNLPMAALPPRV
jgi:hypothetical protein